MNRKVLNIAGICILPFLTFLIFYFVADGFGMHTIKIILSQSMIPITLGLAMGCVMPAGLMDFSPGARVLLGAVIGGICAEHWRVPGLILGCFAGAMIGGFIIALLYRYLRIPSMVVSLGVVLVMEAVTDRIAKAFGGSTTVKISSELAEFTSYPNNIVITVLACVIFYYIYYKTKLGYLINATGNDEALLKGIGVKVESVKFKAFAVSGIFCFFGAMQQLCYSGSVAATTGMGTMNMVFKPMMGVLIAMQLIRLINNMPIMIIIGEIVIATIFNGFIALGLTDNIQNIVLGVFLLIVMGISENSSRFIEYRRKQEVRRKASPTTT